MKFLISFFKKYSLFILSIALLTKIFYNNILPEPLTRRNQGVLGEVVGG